MELRDHSGARGDLRIALELGAPPAYEADARATWAYLLAQLGDVDAGEVDAELAAARTIAPVRALIHLRAAQIATLRGDHDVAVGEAEQALRGRPPLTPHGAAEARRLRDRG